MSPSSVMASSVELVLVPEVPQAASTATEAIASPTAAPRRALRVRFMMYSFSCSGAGLDTLAGARHSTSGRPVGRVARDEGARVSRPARGTLLPRHPLTP